jgi:anti-anti-sigma factor
MDLERLFDIPPEDSASLRVEWECGEARRARMVLSGEVDAVSADRLQKAVVEVLRHHRPRAIEMDLHEVSFLDSAGLRGLVLCTADAQQMDCQVRVTHAPPAVYRVLQLTGLLELFGLAESQRSEGLQTGTSGASLGLVKLRLFH